MIQVMPEEQDILCPILEIPDKLCPKYKRIVVIKCKIFWGKNVYFFQNTKHLRSTP